MIISLLASISVDVSVLYVCLISGDLVLDTYSNFINGKIKKIDFVIYTHEHADQTHGINELRPFFWINKSISHTISTKKYETSESLYRIHSVYYFWI